MAKLIEDVRGIGPATAALLVEAGIRTVESLATATISQVSVVKGFSEIRAARVIQEARILLAADEVPETTTQSSPAQTKLKAAKSSPKKKKKGDKKKKDNKVGHKKNDKKKTEKKKSSKKKSDKKSKKKK